MTKILAAATADKFQIRQLHLSAFPDNSEADLVEALVRSGDAIISLIAKNLDDQIIGHVMFSKLDAPFRALALAPVAVKEKYRKQALAAKLIRTGLKIAADENWQGAIVLGNPAYYQRFGFSLELAKCYDCPYSGPHLMAMALGQHSLPRHGKISYPSAFEGI